MCKKIILYHISYYKYAWKINTYCNESTCGRPVPAVGSIEKDGNSGNTTERLSDKISAHIPDERISQKMNTYYKHLFIKIFPHKNILAKTPIVQLDYSVLYYTR